MQNHLLLQVAVEEFAIVPEEWASTSEDPLLTTTPPDWKPVANSVEHISWTSSVWHCLSIYCLSSPERITNTLEPPYPKKTSKGTAMSKAWAWCVVLFHFHRQVALVENLICSVNLGEASWMESWAMLPSPGTRSAGIGWCLHQKKQLE